MKTVVQINVCCDGSTGRIMNSIHDIYNKSGNHMYCAYGRGRTLSNDDYIRIGGDIDIYGHVAITRLCDLHGFGSGSATKRLIQKFELLKPDLVHLHNIHGYYLNIELLFGYLKKK